MQYTSDFALPARAHFLSLGNVLVYVAYVYGAVLRDFVDWHCCLGWRGLSCRRSTSETADDRGAQQECQNRLCSIAHVVLHLSHVRHYGVETEEIRCKAEGFPMVF